MNPQTAVVVTSIAPPGPILRALEERCTRENFCFILIGDVASPSDFRLENCAFYSIEAQKKLHFQFAQKCPLKHYSRKNIGYLLAMKKGAQRILETDDDNLPLARYGFYNQPQVQGPTIHRAGWVNVYPYFTEFQVPIWPRGFPLSCLKNRPPDAASLPAESAFCPVQQGLVLGNPDVDALWRLVFDKPVEFQPNPRILILKENSWCPFNSQNTAWFPEAFPLLYLPSSCSFRMTDIWRSFIAQRIAWTCGWGIVFHEPTMTQQRNEHDLMKDFEEEIPGYRWNYKICEELQALPLQSGKEHIAANLRQCYDRLVSRGFLPKEELELLDAWIADLAQIQAD
jgi:hypothetical protein